MSADLVWATGGDQATSFHDHAPGARRTGCGFAIGDVTDGQPAYGRFLTRAEAEAAGLTECRRCYGLSERHPPSLAFSHIPESKWRNGR